MWLCCTDFDSNNLMNLTEQMFGFFSALGSLGDSHFSLSGPPGVAHPWGHSARGLEGRGLLSQTWLEETA